MHLICIEIIIGINTGHLKNENKNNYKTCVTLNGIMMLQKE